jgi:AraC family transcriptional regulator
MPEEQPLALDFLQEATPEQILPNLPILTSHQSSWNSIHLAHHRQPAWELPEMYSNQHIIYLPSTDRTATVEVTMEGRVCNHKFYVDEYANGCFGILPAELVYKLCWNINVEFIHCYIEPSFLAQIAHESVNPDRVELLFQVKRYDLLVRQIGLALRADLETNKTGSRFYADSLATALCAHVLHHYSTRKHTFRAHEDGMPQKKLNQAIEYIHQHLGENLSLTAIANELGMSHFYFCRLFKQSMGLTPHQYLIQQRVERAKQLLKQPGAAITNVALDCGFANLSHFAKYFRKHTGISPKRFREL